MCANSSEYEYGSSYGSEACVCYEVSSSYVRVMYELN